MATKTIAWATGSGNITLTYIGQGNGSISVSSSENNSFDDRSQNINIVTTNGTPQQAVSVLIKQKGKTYPVGEVFNFAYTGSVQQITLPKGKYKLQCWGAQGGNVTGTYAVNGSKGGYSEGVLTLTKATTLYVFVGGQGTSYTSSDTQTDKTVINGGWNGGGGAARTSLYNSGGIYGRSFPRGGGGGTDIALVSSSMSYSSGRTTRDSASLLSRIIVAGGGGGASARHTTKTVTNTQTFTNILADEDVALTLSWTASDAKVYLARITIEAKNGKTYKIVNPTVTTSDEYTLRQCGFFDANGSGVGSHSTYTYTSTKDQTLQARYYINVPLGQSFTGTIHFKIEETYTESTTETTTSSSKSNTTMQGGGVSGKGSYGGKQTSAGYSGGFGLGGNSTYANYRYSGGGGGGGWYGGGRSQSDTDENQINSTGGGSGFVNTSANASSRPSGYTGLQLDSGTTKDGSTSFESVSGGTETGHSGNGYARITVIE